MKTGTRFLLALLLSLAAATSHADDPVPVTEQEARDLIARYYAALQEADLSTLETVLGGNLLTRRRELWGQTEYRELLLSRHQNSSLRITSVLLGQRDGKAIVRVVAQEDGTALKKDLTIARLGDEVRLIDERIAFD
jgi:hypothetical protein